MVGIGNKKKERKPIKGMTLIEALVATAIIGIGFVAVFQMVRYSVQSIGVSGERTKANYLVSMVAEDVISEKHSESPTANTKLMDHLLILRGSGTSASWSMGTCSDGTTVYNNHTDAFSNKKEKWDNWFSTKRIKCNKKEPNRKSLKVFDICNNSAKGNSCKYENNQIYNGTGIYEKWYLGRMEVRVPVGGTTVKNGKRVQREKKRILYFQIH